MQEYRRIWDKGTLSARNERIKKLEAGTVAIKKISLAIEMRFGCTFVKSEGPRLLAEVVKNNGTK
jgi:hypothetical protein